MLLKCTESENKTRPIAPFDIFGWGIRQAKKCSLACLDREIAEMRGTQTVNKNYYNIIIIVLDHTHLF